MNSNDTLSWYDMCCEDDPNFDNFEQVQEDFNVVSSWDEEYDDNEYNESNKSYIQGIRQNSCPINIKRINERMMTEVLEKRDSELENEEIEKENELYKNNVVSKLSWIKSPSKRKIDNEIVNSIMDNDDYPCLGFNPPKKQKKEVVVEKIIDIPNEEGWIDVKKKERKNVENDSKNTFTRTKMCSSLNAGKKCNNKGCSYAHSIDELKINDCKFINCNMVIKEDGYFFNTNNKVCNNIHNCESKDNYLKRVGIQKNGDLQPTRTLEKTQLCKSLKEKIKCPHGNNCRFAHTFGELVVKDCSYGEKCKGIKLQNNGSYSNTLSKKVCSYKHPRETKENYKYRVFN
jgi:hypothetical protein